MVWHTNLMHVWLWLRLSFCVCYFSLNVYNLEKKKQNILWPMKSHGSPPCMFEALRSFESFDEMHEDPAQRILLVSQSIMASLKLKCSRYGKEQFHDFTHIWCFWCQKNPIEKLILVVEVETLVTCVPWKTMEDRKQKTNWHVNIFCCRKARIVPII